MQLRAQQTSSVFRKRNYNQYGASSLQAWRAGDWIDAAADIPQTAELQGGAAPSHNWLLTIVSPTTPVTPRVTRLLGPGLAVLWLGKDEAGRGQSGCAQLPAHGAKPTQPHNIHCALCCPHSSWSCTHRGGCSVSPCCSLHPSLVPTAS